MQTNPNNEILVISGDLPECGDYDYGNKSNSVAEFDDFSGIPPLAGVIPVAILGFFIWKFGR